MAKKRMFSNNVIYSDKFLSMSQGAQLLYFFLNMLADDEGFNSHPDTTRITCKASIEDFKQLIERGYIIPFESGVIVIRHWYINNSLSVKTYKESTFVDEKELLGAGKTGEYELLEVLPTGSKSIPLLQEEKGRENPLSAKDLSNSYGIQLQSVENVPVLEEKNVDEVFHSNVTTEWNKEDKIRLDKINNKREDININLNINEEQNSQNLEKTFYGENHNVFLSQNEYDKLHEKYKNADDLINNLGFYLMNSERVYRSHYALACKIANEDKWPKKRSKAEIQQEEIKLEENKQKNKRLMEIMTENTVSLDDAEKIYQQECDDAKARVMDKIKHLSMV